MIAAKSTVRSVLVACLFASLMLATALCQAGRIAGTIKNADGKPIPGAIALLFSQDGGTELKRAAVDSSGGFTFENVPNGSYKLGARALGYSEQEPKLILVTGAMRVVNLTLISAAQTANNETAARTTTDKEAKPPLAFSPAGIRGTIAPSGYSTGLSSEETAQVNRNVSEMGADLLSSFLPSGSAAECGQEPALLRAVERDPQGYRAHRDLGLFFLRHGDYVRSAKYLQMARALSPADDENLRDLAVALLGANRAQDAVALLEPVRGSKQDKDTKLMQLLALAYERAGNADKARAMYLDTAASDGSAETAFDCGMGMIRLNALEDARTLLAGATSAHPDSARLWLALGIAENLLEHKAAAVQAFLLALDKDTGYEPTYSFIANLAASVPGTEAEIRGRLAAFVVQRPESAAAHLNYALAMWKQNGRDASVASDAEIIAQLKIVLAREPRLSRAHFVLGDVYASGNELANAEQEFRTVIELDPASTEAHYRLAQIYRKEGHLDQAAAEIEKFRSLRGKHNESEASSAGNLQGLAFRYEKHDVTAAPCPH